MGKRVPACGAIYRHREVEYILRNAESALQLTADTFRGFDHGAMVAEIWPKLPALRHVLIAGETVGEGMRSFDEILGEVWEDQVPWESIDALRPDPNDVATLMFTSGTTAD